MLEQSDRSRLIGLVFLFALYWTVVLSSEFIRRTWLTVEGPDAMVMIFLAFISSLACLAFLIAFLPRTIAIFLIVLAALASSAANVFCYEYDTTISAVTMGLLFDLSGTDLVPMARGSAIFWIVLSFLPIFLMSFVFPDQWTLETRLAIFSVGLGATLVACGLCLTVIPSMAWKITEWDRLWELFTPINLIKAAFIR